MPKRKAPESVLTNNAGWDRRLALGALEQVLGDVGLMLPGFPKRTVILRDPADADCYIVVTNEDDDVAGALRDVIHPPAKAEES